MIEIWKSVSGYEASYEVSNYGNIRGKERTVKKWDGERTIKQAAIKPFVSSNGYIRVCLCFNSCPKKYQVHRLVAIAFIPNIKGKPFINHIDGVKSNNYVENLEWCTQSENIRHRYDVLGQAGAHKGKFGKHSPRHNPVIQFTKSGEEIARFDSMMDAQRDGYRACLISKCCNGVRKTHKGFKWEFA